MPLPRTPLLTDSERENLKDALRNPKLRGWSSTQELNGWKILEADNKLRSDAAAAATGANRGERIAASGVRGIYRGISSLVGAPVDLANAGLRAVGAGSPTPVGGSESLMNAFERLPGIGSDRNYGAGPGRTVSSPLGSTGDERLAGRVGQEVGAGVVGVGGLGVAARAGAQSTTALGRAFVEPLRRAPGKVALSEVTSAVGAGAGAGVAAEAGAGSLGETAAAFGGAVAPAAALGLGAAIGQATARGVRVLSDTFNIGGHSERRNRAAGLVRGEVARVIQDNASDPTNAAYRTASVRSRFGSQEVPEDPEFAIDAARSIPPTLGVGDEGLERLTVAVAKTNPEVAKRMGKSARQLRRSINELQVLDEPGNVATARDVAERNIHNMTTRVQNDLLSLENSFKDYANTNPQETAQKLREAIVATRQDTKALVTKAYDNVDPEGTSRIITSTTKKALNGIRAEQTKAVQFSSNEARLYSVVENFSGVESFKEMMSLRREVADGIQRTNSSTEKYRLRQLLDGIDQNIDQIATGNYPNGLKERYQFAKGFHESSSRIYRTGKVANFRRQGVVGDIVGGEVPASATLSRMIHTGQGSLEDAQHLKLALGGLLTKEGKVVPGPVSKENQELLKNYLTRMAYDATVDATGKIVPHRFAKWRKAMGPVLDQFSIVKDSLNGMGKLASEVDRLGLEAKRLKAISENRAVTTMIEGDPVEAMDRVFRSSDRAKQAAMLRNLVKGDAEAENGLKQGFLDWFHQKHQGVEMDSVGSTIYKAGQMAEFLGKPENIRAMAMMGFSPSHVGKLKRMATLMDGYNKTYEASRTLPNIDTGTGQTTVQGLTLNSLLSRFYAVSRGVVSPRFVASEVGARIVSRQFNRLTQEETVRLLERAFVDPEVLTDLLGAVSHENAAGVVTRLQTHLVSIGLRTSEDEESTRPRRPPSPPLPPQQPQPQ